MAFRGNTKATPAELQSFEIVPETCPRLERALEKLSRGPSVEFIEQVLGSYGIEMTPRLRNAIAEIHGKHTALANSELRDVVLLEGTYPLRLALVRQIEKTMPPGQPESRYVYWLESRGKLPESLRRVMCNADGTRSIFDDVDQ